MDIYMRITNAPINGDSTAKSFSKEFELYSLSYSAVNPGGRATLTPITVSLAAYNGPQLLSAVFDGKAHDVRFSVVKQDSKGAFVTYELFLLTGATITSFREMMNSGDDRPVIELAIAYTGLKYSQNDVPFTFSYDKNLR